MSATWALRLDLLLGAVSFALLGAAVWAAVQCFRRSWPAARTLAARSFWLALVVAVLASIAIPMAVVHHEALGVVPDVGPSQKARILAESIAEGMNCTVAVALVIPIAAVAWVVALWHLRRANRERSGVAAR
jgi:hypothetical protein